MQNAIDGEEAEFKQEEGREFMGKLSKSILTASTIIAASISTPAMAWDGVETGVITQIDTTDAENYGFRIYLDSGNAMCSAGYTWAFMNKSWDNYEVTASLLISAWLSGKTVIIYTNVTNGHCGIAYVRVN